MSEPTTGFSLVGELQNADMPTQSVTKVIPLKYMPAKSPTEDHIKIIYEEEINKLATEEQKQKFIEENLDECLEYRKRCMAFTREKVHQVMLSYARNTLRLQFDNKLVHRYNHICKCIILQVQDATTYDIVKDVFEFLVFPVTTGIWDVTKDWQINLSGQFMDSEGLAYFDENKGKQTDGFTKIVAQEKASVIRNFHNYMKNKCGIYLSITGISEDKARRTKNIFDERMIKCTGVDMTTEEFFNKNLNLNNEKKKEDNQNSDKNEEDNTNNDKNEKDNMNNDEHVTMNELKKQVR
jgi:hypothetical protein